MLRELLATQFRLLAFRPVRPNLREHLAEYLIYGAAVTWLAGLGRYWDNPRAEWWQSLGLGSLLYVAILAGLLWAIIAPLRPKNWTYEGILVFLMLTSLPALLYAIPVERFMPLERAQSVNAWFLGIVATWRVALLVLFLRRAAGLSGLAIVVATLLPLVLIIVTLALLNLEHVVFDLMSGNRPESRSPNDLAYSVVFLLAVFSFLTLPLLAAAYVWLAWRAYLRK